MLATLVLIAEILILRKSHFWLTSLSLILFLYFVADRAECACLKNPGTVYARTMYEAVSQSKLGGSIV